MHHVMTEKFDLSKKVGGVGNELAAGSFPSLENKKSDEGREEYDQTVGNLVLKMVALLERVQIAELKDASRGKAEVCLARQMAMYLMHTVFSCSYHSVAAFFARDRTTISHACKLVEDLRDNEPFDKSLETMENLLISARALYELERQSNLKEGSNSVATDLPSRAGSLLVPDIKVRPSAKRV